MMSMSRLSRQIISLLIAMLLVLSPLQGAMAGIASGGMAPMSSMQSMPAGDMVMDHNMMQKASASDHQCDECNTNACCSGAQCLSGHCATCAFGLVPVISRVTVAIVRVMAFAPDSTHLQQVPDTLFRPPRA